MPEVPTRSFPDYRRVFLAGNRRRIRFHRGDHETCPEYEVVRADAALVLLSFCLRGEFCVADLIPLMPR